MLLFSGAAFAEPVSPLVRSEIDALLGKLSSSGCEFSRNESWHSADEAKSHLLGKLHHLERKGLVQSTEQFIERAASASSLSGKPYLVKCGSAAPIESRTWLYAELKDLRARAKAKAVTRH
jgi:hypothetical protein